jgi:universal stress protein A
MRRFRRVVFASDFSRASGAAFAQALEMAKGSGGALTIVHVLAPVIPVAGDAYLSPDTYVELETSARAHAERQLGRLVTKAKQAKVRARGLVRTGVPHAEIVRAAKAARADLLVIGTHGRTGLARFFLGSVAARVIATASCPVLTVRSR